VFTNHKPLLEALGQHSDPWLARQQRQLSFIAKFATRIWHIASQSNVLADPLSCPAENSLPPPPQQQLPEVVVAACGSPGTVGNRSTEVKAPSRFAVSSSHAGLTLLPSTVDLLALAAAQAQCPDCQRATTSSSLQVAVVQMQGSSIMVDTLSGVFRPLVPAAFRRPVFDAIHCLAHPGIKATRRLIPSHFVWPCLASQLAASDRGSQFCSMVWDSFILRLGIKSRLTTLYHPQSNGAIERFHRHLKDMLRARLAGSDWVNHLPWLMLGF
jgi:hypothetical protein